MAIGDNNTNNQNKLYENTYYSRLRFKNAESKLSLAVSFKSGLLILEISELKEGFKYEPVISIYLSPTKAKLFAEEIIKFKEYLNSGSIVEGKAFGVNAGMGDKVSFIGLHADSNKNIFATIGKINSEGKIIDSREFGFNKQYHFSLEWENIKNMDVAKSYNDTLEIDQLYELCYDFGRQMSGAAGYAAIDLGRFDTARILKKMDPIYDKLGIERKTYSSNTYTNRTNNFLDNAQSVSSNHMSIEDMEDLL